mgnify:CR=1 FL=1
MDQIHLTQAAARGLAESVSRGESEGELLARCPGRVTVRQETESGTVIVKLWRLSDPRSVARRLLRRTKGRSEFESLQHLTALGVPVPDPLFFFQLSGRNIEHHEAMIVKDLAPCEPLHAFLHSCSKHGDSSEVERLNAEVIRITAAMIESGVVDNDHRLGNFVVGSDKAVYRLDFENAAPVGSRWRKDQRLGVMIGALLSSHAWSTRFVPDQTPRFVEQLMSQIHLSSRALDTARKFTAAEITRLADRSGFQLSQDLGL